MKNRQVEFQTAKEYADSNNMKYYESSAKTGNNVENIFLELASSIKERVIVLPQKKIGKKFNIYYVDIFFYREEKY